MRLRSLVLPLFVVLALACNKKKDDAAKTDKTSEDEGKGEKGSKKKSADDDDPCGRSFGDEAKNHKDNSFDYKCPKECGAASLWGTGWYTTDSSICSAAIHAGAIEADKGGKVTVSAKKGLKSYKGTKAHGFESGDWGAFDTSFAVNDSKDGNDTPKKGEKFKVDCAKNAKEAADDSDSEDFKVLCPPGCKKSGKVWGTGKYTTDSSICPAAIHAGVITDDDGGDVHVKIVNGESSYKGSKKNGVTSEDYGEYEKSFTVK